jgi:hypothetical protein
MDATKKENNQNQNERKSIRRIYIQKKLAKEKENKKIRRYSEEEFSNKFLSIQKSGNTRLGELSDLLQHNNLNLDFLDFYFDKLFKLDKEKFKNQIKIYYPFMNVKLCNKYSIKKEKSERDRFFELYEKIISSDTSKIKQIVSDEYKFPKELENFSFSTIEKRDFNRWGLYGTQIIDFNNIYNEEYFYYALSNFILKNLIDNKSEKYNNYTNTYKSLKSLIENVDLYSKSDPEFFEYVFLFLLNAEDNSEINTISNTPSYEAFISSMTFELINKQKNSLLNDNEIINKFKEAEVEAKIINNNLHLSWRTINEVINNYKNYYITIFFVSAVCGNIIHFKKKSLMDYLKFEFLKNPKNYFDGLLYQIIEKYVSSNLSKTSLSKCFNINFPEYEIIEEEICTKNIHKYIRMLPYNSKKDTGRTLKQFAKILIDPSKQKIMQNIQKKTENEALKEYLEKFINIVYRKFIFEHEHNHLCNDLLFFYYVDKDYEINTPPKKIKDNKVTLVKKLSPKEQRDKSHVFDESGEIFETMTYGRVQKFFKLKQLLFIANEKNDELSVDEYKKKYNEIMGQKGNVEELFKVFQDNHLILSDLVNNIHLELKKELSLDKNKGKTIDELADEIIACKNEFYEDNSDKIESLDEFGEMIVIDEIEHYDCHIPDKQKFWENDD